VYLSESNELEIVITTATGGSGDIATGYDDDRAMFLLRYDGTQAIRTASYTHTHTHTHTGLTTLCPGLPG